MRDPTRLRRPDTAHVLFDTQALNKPCVNSAIIQENTLRIAQMGKFARKASNSSSTLFSLVHTTAKGISNEQKIMDGCLLWPLGAVTLVCYITTRA